MAAQFISDATEETFRKEVLEAELPVVVDFWAPWCGPCIQIAPWFEKLADEHSARARFVKINVDDADELARTYGVTGIPTVKVFRGGNVVLTLVGGLNIRNGKKQIEEALTK